MRPEIYKFLFDMLTSINSINDYLGDNKDFSKYASDKLLRRAIEREFEIIGEAANRITRLAPGLEIENARKLIDLRNMIIHGYDKIDDEIIWSIIVKNLPDLKNQVEALLS